MSRRERARRKIKRKYLDTLEGHHSYTLKEYIVLGFVGTLAVGMFLITLFIMGAMMLIFL